MSLEKFAGLGSQNRIKEIGSGYGRVALPLTQMLSERGSYIGVEVMREAVDWCRDHVSPLHPHFNFYHLDIYNEFYNPSGKGSVANTRLPFADGAFDLVFLTSVFTHLVPEDVQAYMRKSVAFWPRARFSLVHGSWSMMVSARRS